MRIHVNGVERDATADEKAVIEATQADMLAHANEQNEYERDIAKARANALAKLVDLGLTEIEIAALVG
jgi:hypothetical protein